MKAVERAKLVRSLRQESRRLRLLVLVIAFFLVTLTFFVVSKPDALLFARTRTISSSLLLPYQFSPVPIHWIDCTALTRACALSVSLQ
jgi:hypothetical protein